MWVWTVLPSGTRFEQLLAALNRRLKLLEVTLKSLSRGIGHVDALARNDATPLLGRGMMVTTQNTSATEITELRGGRPGQRVTIVFEDATTTVKHGGKILLKGDADRVGAVGTCLTLVTRDGETWIEDGRG